MLLKNIQINYYLLTLLLTVVCLVTEARSQSKGNGEIQVVVIDSTTNELLPFAFVSITNDEGLVKSLVADENATALFKFLKKGEYIVEVSHIGHNSKAAIINLNNIKDLVIALSPRTLQMQEVVVTASESKGTTSSSVIDVKAMQHLQPSSFSDILELLPGGVSKTPNLSVPNQIHIREVALQGSNYSTSSLGTAFVIDGSPISTNANLQNAVGAWEHSAASRNFMNKGVDMRTLSTDDIKNIEVVRGIPSVEYGDLTSGLVKIERKYGGNMLDARFKADMSSKLFYAGKAFDFKKNKFTLNLGVDYMDSKADPRNLYENYKRLTASVRTRKTWIKHNYVLSLTNNLDYTGSFDNEKIDPDLNYGKEESYKSSLNKILYTNTIKYKNLNKSFFKSLSINGHVSYQSDIIDRNKFVQLQRPTAIPNNPHGGEHNGIFLPYKYTTQQIVDGKPMTAFMKAMAVFGNETTNSEHSYKVGINWLMDKNFGKGQVFDLLRPPYPGMSNRPRAFKDIPSRQDLSAFVEYLGDIQIGANKMTIMAGVRSMMLLNLADKYKMSGKMYFDPRMNLRWAFPDFNFLGQNSNIELSGGIGWHTKMPTLSQLYPETVYHDIEQLNYHHTNENYRVINFMTYVVDATNYDIKPATNLKWELRGDLNIGRHRFSATYFNENMKSGFRTSTFYNSYTFKDYDTSQIEHSSITAPPNVADLAYVRDTMLLSTTYYTNGSQTIKKGIEFTYSSPRFEAIRTRLTVNGAWFNTTYKNSQPLYVRPNVVIDGKQIEYVGIYDDDDGYIRNFFNTNFMFDTDIPSLGLGFSVSMQCVWFTSSQSMRRSLQPTKYMDPAGNIYPFTEKDADDYILKWLVRDFTDSQFARNTVPFEMRVNLKATKKLLKNKILIAVFANNLLSISPNYKSNNIIIRRYTSPYFGMEINIKI